MSVNGIKVIDIVDWIINNFYTETVQYQSLLYRLYSECS